MKKMETKVIVQSGKKNKKPRYNVVSLRVSEEERRYLEAQIVGEKKSVSDVMREALTFYSSHCKHA